MTIYTVTSLRDDRGSHIEAYSEFGAALPIYVKFVGKAIGKFDVGNGPGNEQVMPYDTLIDATTVDEAFSKYRECVKTRGNEIQNEIRANLTRSRLSGKR